MLLRAGLVGGSVLARIAGGLVLGVAGLVFVLARTRHVRRTDAVRAAGPWPGAGLLAAVGATAVGVSVVALLVTVGAALDA